MRTLDRQSPTLCVPCVGLAGLELVAHPEAATAVVLECGPDVVARSVCEASISWSSQRSILGVECHACGFSVVTVACSALPLLLCSVFRHVQDEEQRHCRQHWSLRQ